MTRVLFVQYGNPSAYPPVLRAATILRRSGCDVRILGVESRGTEALQPHPDLAEAVELLRGRDGAARGAADYARFSAWSAGEARRWRASWIYASDARAAPAALLAASASGARLVYHEHDALHGGRGVAAWSRGRALLARRAELVVVPNAARADRLAAETGARRVFTVWNVPLLREAGRRREPRGDGLRMLFHGAITQGRHLSTAVRALALLPDHVSLSVAGYETIGATGLCDALLAEAETVGVGARVRIVGPVPHARVAELCDRADFGLALTPSRSDDPNLEMLAGASNKVFEFMARSVVPVLNDHPQWRAEFVEPGLALACDPASPESLAAAIRRVMGRDGEIAALGERGRARVLEEWHYERAFEPVRRVVAGGDLAGPQGSTSGGGREAHETAAAAGPAV